MQIKGAIFCLAAALAVPALAQDARAPLTAIDWLDDLPARTALEPPVTGTAQSPNVVVAPLGEDTRRRIGLLPLAETRLGPDMWQGGAPDALVSLLRAARDQRLPVGQELLLLLMLAEADDLPGDRADATRWTLARIDTLIALGAVDPAKVLLDQMRPESSPHAFERWMSLSLLSGSEETPCAALLRQPALSDDEALRVYCTARLGQFQTATLLFGTSTALGLIPSDKASLLEGFLDPDLIADGATSVAPVRPDALTFRLYEAIGAPLPTAPLQRAYAHHDLTGDAGWKAQLEAAERLARAGVLSGNQLLGFYSDRAPAASGGIWDRVAAFQDFEAALASGKATDVNATLPPLWRSMKSAALEVLFAELFARDVSGLDLEGVAATVRYHMILLSRDPLAARAPNAAQESELFLGSVAAGKPDPALARTAREFAVLRAYDPDVGVQDRLASSQQGEHLLRVLANLSASARGDNEALTNAMSGLRNEGFDQLARRVALQSLILLELP